MPGGAQYTLRVGGNHSMGEGTPGEQATGLQQRLVGMDTADPFKVPSPPLFM